MGMDKYFTSAKVLSKPTQMVLARWKALQRLPHDLMAAELDELYRRQRLGVVTDDEIGLIDLWEKKRQPYRRG